MRVQRQWLRGGLLLAVLAMVATVAFLPHWVPWKGDRNPYPIHVDEYSHWAYFEQAQQEQRVAFADPFSGPGGSFELESDLHERGYQVFVAVLQETTGIPWLPLLEFAPTIGATFLALCAYVLAERWGAGLEAALLIGAIPTTLRYLGPGFMVPIAFSLPLLALALHLALNEVSLRSSAAVTLTLGALWTVHVVAALWASVLVALTLVGSLRTPGRATLGAAAVGVPIVIVWPYLQARGTLGLLVRNPLPPTLDAFKMFGIGLILIAPVGAMLLVARRDAASLRGAISFGVGLLLAELVIYARLVTDKDPLGLFDRTFMILFFLVAILGGIVASRTRVIAIGGLTKRGLPPSVALLPTIAVALLLVSAVGASAVAVGNDPRYQVLNDAKYNRDLAALQILGPGHVAIVDGIDGMAFHDITGMGVAYVVRPADAALAQAAAEFFDEHASDTAFLVENGISVVVTDRPVANPDLRVVGSGLYMLDIQSN